MDGSCLRHDPTQGAVGGFVTSVEERIDSIPLKSFNV